MKRRPATVMVIAIFLGLATVIAALAAVLLGFPETLLDRMWGLNPTAQAGFHPLGRGAGALMGFVGIATAATCLGLLRGRRWAWLGAIAIFVINGLGDVANLLIVRDWMRGGSGALIAATFLFCLLRPNVREYFARQLPSNEAD